GGETKKNVAPGFIERLRLKQRLRKENANLRSKIPTGSILLISENGFYTDRFDNQKINRHIDPLVHLLNDKHPVYKLQLGNERDGGHHWKKTIFYQPFYFNRLYNSQRSDPKIPSMHVISEYGKKMTGLDSPEFSDEFVRRSRMFWRLYHTWLHVLDIIKPSAVFVVCYYSTSNLALMAAARAKGIATVDVQHGKQGMYHAMYTHFSKIPSNGYEMLPSVFLNWGNESVHNMKAHSPGIEKTHALCAVGNAWTALWKQKNEMKFNHPFLDEIKKHERVILVSLQPIEPVMPDFLKEAIKNSPANWLWLLRWHPSQKPDEKLIDELKQSSATVESEQASTIFLYALLPLCHVHVTAWSSVCFEANAMGVATIIVHPNGKKLYESQINNHHFGYSESARDILGYIKDPAGIPNRPTGYIIADKDEVQKKLFALVEKIKQPQVAER
ncbi:MAG: hypothetical protein ACHQF2_01345, partial [Flavobacteriales bacterium]